MGFGPWSLCVSWQAMAIPVAIEGMEIGAGEIVASLTPSDGRGVVDDAVAIHVVTIDLDVDSDNNNGLQAPDRTPEEEQLEDAYRTVGKQIAVNSDDVDRDGVPDFLDGFDLDAQSDSPLGAHPDDDQVAADSQLGFVPLVIDLPAPIDPAKALLASSTVARIQRKPRSGMMVRGRWLPGP